MVSDAYSDGAMESMGSEHAVIEKTVLTMDLLEER